MRRLRSGLTYTNVVATLALFLALAEAPSGREQDHLKQLGKGAVKKKNLAKNAVKNKNLAKKAVTSPKLAKGAVKNADIADGAVNLAKSPPGRCDRHRDGRSDSRQPAGPFRPQSGNYRDPGRRPAADPPHRIARCAHSHRSRENLRRFPAPGRERKSTRDRESLVVVAPGAPLGPLGSGGISRAGAEFPIGLTQPGVPQSITMFAVAEAENCPPTRRSRSRGSSPRKSERLKAVNLPLIDA